MLSLQHRVAELRPVLHLSLFAGFRICDRYCYARNLKIRTYGRSLHDPGSTTRQRNAKDYIGLSLRIRSFISVRHQSTFLFQPDVGPLHARNDVSVCQICGRSFPDGHDYNSSRALSHVLLISALQTQRVKSTCSCPAGLVGEVHYKRSSARQA